MFCPIVHDRDQISYREQSETNRNDDMQCVTIYLNIYELNVFPIIWRFNTTVYEHFTHTSRTK